VHGVGYDGDDGCIGDVYVDGCRGREHELQRGQ
jgi:hypothetical protein